MVASTLSYWGRQDEHTILNKLAKLQSRVGTNLQKILQENEHNRYVPIRIAFPNPYYYSIHSLLGNPTSRPAEQQLCWSKDLRSAGLGRVDNWTLRVPLITFCLTVITPKWQSKALQ
jgi:hypothetical protein